MYFCGREGFFDGSRTLNDKLRNMMTSHPSREMSAGARHSRGPFRQKVVVDQTLFTGFFKARADQGVEGSKKEFANIC